MTSLQPIVRVPANACGVYRSTASGLLVDGQDYYRAVYRAWASARRTIYITGWQLDSQVALLRSDDAGDAGGPVTLLPHLNECCQRNPELRVYILAWDFSLVYALERELFQRWRVGWQSHERIRFELDGSHPAGASHHQKMVVVDDTLAFAGGMDLCAHRWDTRDHQAGDPRRTAPGRRPYPPFHDIQARVQGPAATALGSVFRQRWRNATGESLPAGGGDSDDCEPLAMEASLALSDGEHQLPVAISRTLGEHPEHPTRSLREIQQLLEDAVAAAERLVYVETQYLTSKAFVEALHRRMSDSSRSRLQVVLVLPEQPGELKERLTLGATQAEALGVLQDAAATNGHNLGVFHPGGPPGARRPTYVHSKVLIVDDRFLSVGSANLTNRSFGLDSELNLTWDAGLTPAVSTEVLAAVRADLLAEHCGPAADATDLIGTEDLVARLNALTTSSQLCRHNGADDDPAVAVARLAPVDKLIDPEEPFEARVEERLVEIVDALDDVLESSTPAVAGG